jgi:hypothetical protein
MRYPGTLVWLLVASPCFRAVALEQVDAPPTPVPGPLPVARPVETQVSPDVLSLQRLAEWEVRERSLRRIAWTRTLVSAGSGAFAVAAGVEAWGARQEMNHAWLAYNAATPGAEQTSKYEAYRSTWASVLGWSGASVVATAASAWSGLRARAAWRDLPARPVVELRKGSGRIGVEGTW